MFMHPQMPCYAFAVVFFFGAIELLLAGKRTLALLVNLELQEWQLEARKGNQVGGGVGAATRRLRRRALSSATNCPRPCPAGERGRGGRRSTVAAGAANTLQLAVEPR